ncbi:MAG: hypothetical protein IKC80_10085 [Kiritimatiellae bacterium]|nr:hypothetical protein [Kiritimatiellia bacterium]
MKKGILLVLALAALVAPAAQYSKLALVMAAKASGKWGDLKSFIASAGLVDEWQACDYLSDEFPQFAQITNAVVVSGLATAAEVSALLEAARDPAVSDALIGRVYSSDMAKADGRVRWHGKVVSTVFDTNKLEKVQTHEDGYVHRLPFALSSPGSVESQLSAAERAALAEKRRREADERRERKRQARIAELETNLTFHVSALMKSKRWPESLARLYLQHELNTLVGTNVVNVVIEPQK